MPPSLQEVQALQILEEALSSPIGIIVEITSSDPLPALTHRAKGILYRFRRDKPAYRNLIIRVDPEKPDSLIWIYPGKEDPDETPEGLLPL